MMIMTNLISKPNAVMQALEERMARHGAQEHLAAARDLARQGLPVAQIAFLLRWQLATDEIEALLEDAGQPIR